MGYKQFLIILMIIMAYPIYAIVHFFLGESASFQNVIVVAHRGGALHRPENTIEAVNVAISGGVKMVEVDVRITKDKKLVLIHDKTVDRTTPETGKVSALSYQELLEMDAGSHFSPDFSGVTIAGLEELLAMKIPEDMGIILELKDVEKPYFLEELALQINQCSFKERIILITFNKKYIKVLRATFPENKIGSLHVTGFSIDTEEKAEIVGLHWVNFIFFPNKIKKLKAAGKQVFVWTVNNQTIKEKLAGTGLVDGIITDNP